MDYLHRKTESQQPPAPMGVVHRFVVFDGGLEPARDDYFVGDTAVSVVRRRHDAPGEEAMLRLVAPVDGTVVALDPDIPPANQKLLLHAKGGAESSVNRAVWKIDGESVGVGEQLMWAPRPGKHNVELLDADGRTHGRATITVRGAAQKGATSLLPRG
jgi:penicillin-binding protein 1C